MSAATLCIYGANDPGIPDYPNYSTALAVSALCRSISWPACFAAGVPMSGMTELTGLA